eukprot:12040-Heterococcus_DN1.PRE.1
MRSDVNCVPVARGARACPRVVSTQAFCKHQQFPSSTYSLSFLYCNVHKDAERSGQTIHNANEREGVSRHDACYFDNV